MKSDSIRIANCSGFYGDKLSVARDMIEGGPIDVLTGDYLAELTMTILYNQKLKRGEQHGYVGTFLKQFRDVAKLAQEKNIKIVTNAGGLNPSSMANSVKEIIDELNLDLKVAHIEGDDLMPRIDELYQGGEKLTNIDKSLDLQNYKKKPITANAYLGAWGIKEALDNGAIDCSTIAQELEQMIPELMGGTKLTPSGKTVIQATTSDNIFAHLFSKKVLWVE